MTDPDSDITPGVSGLRMCESAKAGKFEDFKKGLPHTLTEHDSRRLMNEVRKGLGQEPIMEQIVLNKDKLREDYFAGKIFNLGDIVECSGQYYEIVKRGSNHLLLKEESGVLVSKWIQDVTTIVEQSKDVTKELVAKKYKEFVKNATMMEPAVEIGEPTKGDGKEQPKFGDKLDNESDIKTQMEKGKIGNSMHPFGANHVRKQKVNYHLGEDVYTSDTKTKDYQVKDAEGNWVWRKRKIHPKRINFAASKMNSAPAQQTTPQQMEPQYVEKQNEAYVKKTSYQKLNARMKTLTGKSLDDRSKELDKIKQDTIDRIAQYKKDGIIKNEHIEKVAGGYEVESEHGNKNLGKSKTLAGAKKRLKQVEYFKHMGEDVEAQFDLIESVAELDKHMSDFAKGINSDGARHSTYKNGGGKIPNMKHVTTDASHQAIFNHLKTMGYKKTSGHDSKPNEFDVHHNRDEMTSKTDPVHHSSGVSAHVETEHGGPTKVHFTHHKLKEEAVLSFESWILNQKKGKTKGMKKIEVKPEDEITESKLNPADPHKDYAEKSKALQDLSRNKDVDQKAVQQRRLDLDKEYSKIKEETKKKKFKNLKKDIQDNQTLNTGGTPPFDPFFGQGAGGSQGY
jgi:hypothetical protein